MYDWDDYRYILAISKASSLPKVAVDLGVAVSTVMRRLEKIQARSDMPIFVKTEQGYRTSELGERLRAVAENMAEQALLADGHLRNASETLDGRIRISGSEVIAPFFLARHLPVIQARNPKLQVELVVKSQSPSQSEQEFDFSLWPKCPSNSELFGRKLTNLRWATYGAPGAENEGAQIDLSASGASPINALDCPFTVNSLIAAAALAAANGPLAKLPCILGECWPGLERKSPPEDHNIGELWVVYRKELRRTRRIKQMLDQLDSAAKEDAPLFLGTT